MQNNIKLNGADYLLLLLYLDNEKPIKGAIRLTKMMFLFTQEIQPILKNKGVDSDNVPNFVAYNFGPFSRDLYEQIDFFSNINFIQTQNIQSEEMGEVDDWCGEYFDGVGNPIDFGYAMGDSKYVQYKITSLGKQYVEKNILPVLNDEHKILLESFKRKIVKTSAKNILRYVYTKYPEYAKNSIIKKDILGGDNK